MTQSTSAPASLIQSLRYHGQKQLSVDFVPAIPCGPKEVRVKVAYCGICGSDIHEYQHGPIFCPQPGGSNPHTGVMLPITMGHEFSGTVLEIGSEVNNVMVGQNVVVDPIIHDRHYGLEPCHACRRGAYNACVRCTVNGLSSPGGGLASETVVRASTCIPLPDSVSLKVGALVEALTISWHAIRISGFQKGQKALVLGAGPIGLGIILLLQVWGAESIIVSEVSKARVHYAEKFGATKVVNPLATTSRAQDKDALQTAVHESTEGEGVDVAFLAGNHQSILDGAIAAVRTGGTICNVAIHQNPYQIKLNDLTFFEKKLVTAMRCNDEDWTGVLEAIEQGKVPFIEDMITSVVPLSKAIDGAFLELINNAQAHVKILIQPDR